MAGGTVERDGEQFGRPVYRFAWLCEEQLGHVERADDDVLEPVQKHQGEDFPAEQHHPRDRHCVRDAEDEERRCHRYRWGTGKSLFQMSCAISHRPF